MKIDIEFNSGAQLPMDAIPGLARLAESHGFDCAWGGEANNKDPTVMLSAIGLSALGSAPTFPFNSAFRLMHCPLRLSSHGMTIGFLGASSRPRRSWGKATW